MKPDAPSGAFGFRLREINKAFYEEKEARRECAGEIPARLGTGFRRA